MAYDVIRITKSGVESKVLTTASMDKAISIVECLNHEMTIIGTESGNKYGMKYKVREV